MKNYRLLNKKYFSIKGEIITLNGANDSIEIRSVNGDMFVLKTSAENVKKCIPYLYRYVSIEYDGNEFKLSGLESINKQLNKLKNLI